MPFLQHEGGGAAIQGIVFDLEEEPAIDPGAQQSALRLQPQFIGLLFMPRVRRCAEDNIFIKRLD